MSKGVEQDSSLEISQNRRWANLLSEADQKKLKEIYAKFFPDLIGNGWEVVDEVGTNTGRLLTRGPYQEEIQQKTARDIIRKMEIEEYDEAERALWQNYREGKGDWKPGYDRPPVILRKFAWASLALVPPLYWEGRSALTINDLEWDRQGITIFGKKETYSVWPSRQR